MTTAIIAMGFIIWLLQSFSNLKRIVQIYKTPTYRISKLPQEGRVEIFGEVEGNTINSPLKRKNCVLWQVVIEEWRSARRGAKWVTIFSQTSKEPFELKDEMGCVKVHPANALLVLNDNYQKSARFMDPLPPRIKSGIEKLGVMSVSFFGVDRHLRVTEKILKSGDKVFVLGDLKSEDGNKRIENNSTMVIGDRSEKEVLGVLFKQVILSFILMIFLVISFSILSTNSQ